MGLDLLPPACGFSSATASDQMQTNGVLLKSQYGKRAWLIPLLAGDQQLHNTSQHNIGDKTISVLFVRQCNLCKNLREAAQVLTTS